jgi:hypothetical protein
MVTTGCAVGLSRRNWAAGLKCCVEGFRVVTFFICSVAHLSSFFRRLAVTIWAPPTTTFLLTHSPATGTNILDCRKHKNCTQQCTELIFLHLRHRSRVTALENYGSLIFVNLCTSDCWKSCCSRSEWLTWSSECIPAIGRTPHSQKQFQQPGIVTVCRQILHSSFIVVPCNVVPYKEWLLLALVIKCSN